MRDGLVFERRWGVSGNKKGPLSMALTRREKGKKGDLWGGVQVGGETLFKNQQNPEEGQQTKALGRG